MTIITPAKCPGAFIPCGAPVPDYDADEQTAPLCEVCQDALDAEKPEPTLRDRDDEDSRKYDEWKDRE